MKNYYEATYILNIDGKEEGIEEMIGVLKNAIESLEGSIRNTRKMDHRKFERVAGKQSAGYYLAVGFDLDSDKLTKLKALFEHDARIYRQFYLKPKKAPQEAAA